MSQNEDDPYAHVAKAPLKFKSNNNKSGKK